MTNIVLVNQSSILTDAEVAAVVPVLQTVFDRDFEPVWGTNLKVVVSLLPLSAGTNLLSATAWPISIQDTTDVPDAGGYHLDDTGTPYGKVFARDAMEAGESWTVDLTHEFLEMCSDPTTNVLIDLPSMPGFKCLRECGDAVEEDTLGYVIDGVQVTDWCTPEYFYQRRVADYNGPCHEFDFMGHIKAPAPALLHGGYLGLQMPDGNWTQVSDLREDAGGAQSRRAKRDRGRLNRMVSKS